MCNAIILLCIFRFAAQSVISYNTNEQTCFHRNNSLKTGLLLYVQKCLIVYEQCKVSITNFEMKNMYYALKSVDFAY